MSAIEQLLSKAHRTGYRATMAGSLPEQPPRRQEVANPSAELIGKVAEGDDSAFSMFYGAVAPRVFGMCRRVLNDRGQAEEVTQDVIVEMWRTAARYDPIKGSVSGWALTVAHRPAIGRYRARHTTRQCERPSEARDAATAYDEITEPAIANLKGEKIRDGLRCCLTPAENT